MVYRVKAEIKAASDEVTPGQESEAKRPQTTRHRRVAAADAGAEETKKNTERARSARRPRDKSLTAVVDGEEVNGDPEEAERPQRTRTQNHRTAAEPKKVPSLEEKKRLVLEKKRQKMKNQYEAFKPKKVYRSKFIEFQVGEWRQYRQNLFVTLDTVVPALPKQPLEEPDDAKYHLEVARIDEQIEKMQEEFKELIS